MMPNTHSTENHEPRSDVSSRDGTNAVTFVRGNITVRLTCNEPSTAALQNFRIALYEILAQMVNREMPPAVPRNNESASIDSRH